MSEKGQSGESLYETRAVNEDGVNGTSYVDRKDGLSVVVSSPLSESLGTNPEELLGLSLSTCFNSTIRAILKEQGKNNQSKVEVPVQMKEETEEKGYYFDVQVEAAVEGVPLEEAEEIIGGAKNRCPVYKLLKGSHTVHLKTVPYQK